MSILVVQKVHIFNYNMETSYRIDFCKRFGNRRCSELEILQWILTSIPDVIFAVVVEGKTVGSARKQRGNIIVRLIYSTAIVFNVQLSMTWHKMKRNKTRLPSLSKVKQCTENLYISLILFVKKHFTCCVYCSWKCWFNCGIFCKNKYTRF